MIVCVCVFILLAFIIIPFLVIPKRLNPYWVPVILFGSIILIFRLSRRWIIKDCTAVIQDDNVYFTFDDGTYKYISFADIITYQVVEIKGVRGVGRGLPALILKNTTDTFSIGCPSFKSMKPFVLFCDALIATLEEYKKKHPEAVLMYKEGELVMKVVKIFLIIFTVFGLLAFIGDIRERGFKITWGDSGFLCFTLIMWILYYITCNKMKKEWR